MCAIVCRHPKKVLINLLSTKSPANSRKDTAMRSTKTSVLPLATEGLRPLSAEEIDFVAGGLSVTAPPSSSASGQVGNIYASLSASASPNASATASVSESNGVLTILSTTTGSGSAYTKVVAYTT